MLLNVSDLWDETQPAFDLCIVGAGAAGITLALELIGTGLKVCVLESGGLSYDNRAQNLARGKNVGHPYYPLDECRDRWLGGTTNSWSGECRPLDDLDFQKRSWVPNSGWPIDRRTLDPDYEKAQEICQLGPTLYEDETLAKKKGAITLHGGDSNAFATSFFQYSPPTRFGIDYRRGLATAENVFVFTQVTTLQVNTDDCAKRAISVSVARPDGATTTVVARCFVLAAGGLEVPRILLNSSNTQASGLGNSYGHLGRYFMEHLFVDNVLGFIEGIPAGEFRLLSQRFQWQGARLRGALTPSPDFLTRAKLPNFCFRIAPLSSRSPAISSLATLVENVTKGRYPPRAGFHVRSALRDWRAIADFGWRRVSHKISGHSGAEALFCHLVAEQVPRRESRVSLSLDRDRFGQNCIELDWQISKDERKPIDKACAALVSAFDQAGYQQFFRQEAAEDGCAEIPIRGGRHHMGTARMSDCERTGVVDQHGRVHGVENLFVAGSAVFPTGGYANPTLTIVALAVRLARHLKDNLRT
jgi:choline dehydrogenase-like flavoprotein